ncbi:MAG: metal ABC transporter ATP-binding protein, partial [Pseudomonadota bacterium]
MTQPLIETCGLTLAHTSAPTLRDIDLTIRPGEIVTVVGPNGSGKSTLLKGLIGALQPVHGSIKRRDDLRIGYVPQLLSLDGTLPMTVNRFLSLPVRIGAAERAAALREAGVPDKGDAQLRTLSGGQFQRVLLARALLNRPNLLILDEPTQGLDQSGAADFYKRIERLRDDLGCAVLMVSHDLHVV